MDGLMERIQELCKAKQVNVKAIEEALGFSNGTIGKWKKAKDVPFAKITAVAEYLGSTPDYLLYGELPEHTSTSGKTYYFDDETAKLAQEMHDDPKQNAFLSGIRKLTPDQFEVMQSMLIAFLRKDGKIDDD